MPVAFPPCKFIDSTRVFQFQEATPRRHDVGTETSRICLCDDLIFHIITWIRQLL